MNSFKHYSSIENSYREKAVDYFQSFAPPETLWCATEKVHGSNFSACCDGSTIKWGKRSSYIENDALISFNRADLVKEKYDKAVLSLFKSLSDQLCQKDKPLQLIRVFGEICGGKYEGYPQKYKSVQKEIQYCPEIEFIVFDILVSCQDTPEIENEGSIGHTGLNHWLDMEVVVASCNEIGIPVSPILSIGTYNDMMQLNPKFESRIHQIFDLPKLNDNYSEGYVIKPLHEVHTPRGRVILKYKNPDFAEKSLPDKKKYVPQPTQSALTESDILILEECLLYINDNRYNAVLSKLSDSEKSNSKKVIGLLVKDAFDDIFKDFEENRISSKNRSIITRTVYAHAFKMFETPNI